VQDVVDEENKVSLLSSPLLSPPLPLSPFPSLYSSLKTWPNFKSDSGNYRKEAYQILYPALYKK
jgi:hypothetical protein